jgi:NTE family protein
MPVPLKTTHHRRYIVDGGLISNLPVFLFAREQKRTGYHVFAFDLIPPTKKREENYRFRDFCSDLVATALEAGDNLHRETISDFISNLVYIPIPVPEGIDTLKFSLSKEERKKLYGIGLMTTWKTLRKKLPKLPVAKTRMQSVQATLNIPVSHVQSLLKALAQEVNDITPVSNLRTHIMLPVSEKELMVTYHFNMDHDTDRELIVGTDSKWARQVFLKGKPTLSNLEQLRAQPEEWRLSNQLVKQIQREQLTLFSVPIREQRRREDERAQRRREDERDEGDCIGVLSVDTATPLGATMWGPEDRAPLILEAMMKWAKIVSRFIN